MRDALVSIAPLTYRQAVTYILMKHSSHLEVRLTAPEDLDGEVEFFKPHLVVCNEVTPLVEADVLSWIQILYDDAWTLSSA
jgi:hypothetical protein